MTQIKNICYRETNKLLEIIKQFPESDRKKAIDAGTIFLEGGVAMLRIAKQSHQNQEMT